MGLAEVAYDAGNLLATRSEAHSHRRRPGHRRPDSVLAAGWTIEVALTKAGP